MIADLRIFSDIEESDIIRASQHIWEVYGDAEEQEVIITEHQHYLLVRIVAQQMNGTKDIFDSRTIGGKFLNRIEKNSKLNLVKVYETDMGTVKITIKDGI